MRDEFREVERLRGMKSAFQVARHDAITCQPPSRVCLSVRLSVTSRYCIETTVRFELAFGPEASCLLCYIVLNSNIYKNKDTFLRNFRLWT